MLKHFFSLFLLLYWFLPNNTWCQTNGFIDSISYENLSEKYYENEFNPEKAKIFASKYLNKAKLDNNAENLLNGYYFLASSNNGIAKKKYCDSIISLSDSLNITNQYYPYLGYLIRGDYYFTNGDFKNALNDYLEAKKDVRKNPEFPNKNMYVDYQIGLLKNRIGLLDESLEIFKSLERENKKIKVLKHQDSINYLMIQFALSDTYMRTKKLDSSSIVNKKGIEFEKALKNEFYTPYFILNQGIVEHLRGNHNLSVRLISNIIPNLIEDSDLPNLSEAHFYLGKSKLILGDQQEAVENLKKVDSLYNILNDLHPSLRETYEILIRVNKLAENNSQQLYYLNRLLKVDSLINSNYQYLSKKIHKEYDTPLLISEKEVLINNLEKKESRNNKFTFLLLGLLLAVVIFSIIHFRRTIKYKRNYDKLISSIDKQNNGQTLSQKESKTIGIAQDVIDSILQSLNEFEIEEGFLDSSITLNSLSKKINSNSSYVSKVINIMKGESFSEYLNNLKLKYATERIVSDSEFRKYSIAAIAEDSGFNSAETFSKRFFEKNGIYPSYFIKKINNSKS